MTAHLMLSFPKAIIFDFDGVIGDSELLSARAFSEALTGADCPTSEEEAIARYTGLSRPDTLAAIASHWGERCPADLDRLLSDTADRHFAAGVPAIEGAVAFITGTVAHLPKAIGSSSTLAYLDTHVDALGLRPSFGRHVYSGREHVTRGKPHPDIYLHAAAQLKVPPSEVLIIEDSPVGSRAAVAAGARVIGLAAAGHCTPDMTDALRAVGVETVAESYDALTRHLGL
jgi:beta-phosphoglucomutase-like phosphatase (HAD superfamily)